MAAGAEGTALAEAGAGGEVSLTSLRAGVGGSVSAGWWLVFFFFFFLCFDLAGAAAWGAWAAGLRASAFTAD